jgi:hypothetical protein
MLLLACGAVLVIWPVFCAVLAVVIPVLEPAVTPAVSAVKNVCVSVWDKIATDKLTYDSLLVSLRAHANVFGH